MNEETTRKSPQEETTPGPQPSAEGSAEPTSQDTQPADTPSAQEETRLPTPEEIREAIRAHVRDPELMLNVVDLGLIYDIQVTENRTAEITMTLTSPGCPAGPMIITDVQRTIHRLFPQLDEVNIHLVWTPFWNPDMMSEEAKEELGIF